jgi:predicted MFS family arabinose efflux permease
VATPIAKPFAWYVISLLCVLLTMSYMDRQILAVLIDPISKDLGISDHQFGLLIGLGFSLSYAVVIIPVAHFLDRGPRIKLVVLGALIWGSASLLSGFATSFKVLVACRALLAFGEAVLTPAVVTLIPDLFVRPSRPLPTSIYFGIPTVAITLTYLAGGAALRWATALEPHVHLAPWRLTLIIMAVPTILVAILMLVTVPEPARERSGRAALDTTARAAMRYLGDYRRLYIGFYIGMSAISAVVLAIHAWIPTALVRAYAMTPAQASSLLGTYGIPAGIAGAILWPKIAALLEARGHAGAMPFMMIAAAAFGTLGAIAYRLHSAEAAIMTFAFMTFLLSAHSPLGSLILQSVTPQGLRARATAINVFAISVIASSLGPMVVVWFNGAGAQIPAATLHAIVEASLALGAIAILAFAAMYAPIVRALQPVIGKS